MGRNILKRIQIISKRLFSSWIYLDGIHLLLSEIIPTSCHAVFVIFISSAVQRGAPCIIGSIARYFATYVNTEFFQSIFEPISYVFLTVMHLPKASRGMHSCFGACRTSTLKSEFTSNYVIDISAMDTGTILTKEDLSSNSKKKHCVWSWTWWSNGKGMMRKRGPRSK